MKNLQNLCRRSLSLLLALVMCISVMQIPAFATEGGEAASGSEPPSSSSSDNSTSSTDTGSTTTTSSTADNSKPAEASGSGDSTGGTDASNNEGSDNDSASESKTETTDSSEPAGNTTETNEPAGSSGDQTTGGTQPAEESAGETPVTQEETSAQETTSVTLSDVLGETQEKDENDNGESWNHVVAILEENKTTQSGTNALMMNAMQTLATDQKGETAQESSKTETTPLPLPENGVNVTVTPSGTATEKIPSDVTIPDGVKPAENGTITWTTTTKPDNVPENATKNADGSWTWTEKKDQDPGLTGFTAVGDPSVIMEPTEDGMIRETITQEYKNENGDTYTKVTEIIKEPNQDTAGKEPDKTDTAITITTTTTDKTETTTVKPGTVEVTMNPVDRDNTNISKEDFDVTGATVTIKNGSDGTYNADVQIGLSGSLKPDGTVTVTVKGPDGKVYDTTLSEVDENGKYTLSGITLEGLAEGETQNISVTITGQQIKEIATQDTSSDDPSDASPKPDTGKVVTIGYDSTNGVVTAVEGTDSNKIKEVHEFLGTLEVTNDFVIYAEKYGQSMDHIDGNICVETMTNGTTINLHGSDKYGDGPEGEGNKVPGSESVAKDYVDESFSYIGHIEAENGTINVNNNSGGSGTIVVNSDINVVNHGGSPWEKVTLENGELKAEDKEKYPELANLEEAIKITDNLSNIATTGEKLIDTIDQPNTNTDLNKLAAAIEYLNTNADTLSSKDVISLTLSFNTLNTNEIVNPPSGSNKSFFKQLMEANEKVGATIVINVDLSKENDEEVSINYAKPGNDVGGYDGRAANVIWNFGAYEGTINWKQSVAGKVVAPNALLNLNYIQSGSAVGKEITHDNELHLAVPNEKKPTIPTTPDKPQTETVTTNLTVSLTVKVDGGEKIITTQGGSNTVKIESVTTNTYEKPNVPTPPPDDDPGGDIPGPGPGPGSNPNPKPDPKPEPEPEPEPPVEIEDPDVPLTPTPEPEPDFPDDPDANTPNVPDVPDVDIPDDDVPLAPKPNLPDYPTVSILDNDVPMASVPSTDDGLVEIEEEEIPLADVPQTGDTFGSWALLAALSLCGVTALALPGKRKER